MPAILPPREPATATSRHAGDGARGKPGRTGLWTTTAAPRAGPLPGHSPRAGPRARGSPFHAGSSPGERPGRPEPARALVPTSPRAPGSLGSSPATGAREKRGACQQRPCWPEDPPAGLCGSACKAFPGPCVSLSSPTRGPLQPTTGRKKGRALLRAQNIYLTICSVTICI